MLKETAAAAVAKLRTNLSDVLSVTLEQHKVQAVIDKNEAEHGDLHEEAAFAHKDSTRRTAIP